MILENIPLVGWIIETLGDNALNILVGKQKARKIRKLLRQQTARASMLPLLPEVVQKLHDKHHVDELIFNCCGTRLETSKIASLFMYGNMNVRIEDEHTFSFLENLIEDIASIASESSSDGVISMQIETRRSAAELKDSISSLVSNDWTLLSRRVGDLEKGAISLEEFESDFEDKPEGYTREYVLAYSRGCKELPPKRMTIPTISNDLAASLASVYFAAKLYDQCIDILQRAEGETDNIQFAVEQVKKGLFDLGPLSEEGLPENSPFAPFALCLNAELAFSAHSVVQASDFFELLADRINPLSLAHKRIVWLWKHLLFQKLDDAEGVICSYSNDTPSWGSSSLLEEYALPLGLALEEQGPEAFETYQKTEKYKIVKPYIMPNVMTAKLRDTSDCSQIVEICKWAIENNHLLLYVECCHKRLSIDPQSKNELLKDFSDNIGIIKENYLGFSFFTNFLNPNISYEEYVSLGSNYQEEPRFHLEAYEKYASSREEAISHIEQAIELMKTSPREPCLNLGNIWIPYLVHNKRDEEVLEILSRFAQNLPGFLYQPLLKVVLESEIDEEVESSLLDQLENSSVKDPMIFVYLARYHFTKDNELDALRCAMKSFRMKENMDAALIAFQMHLVLNMDIPKELAEYIREADTPETNFLFSEFETKRSNPEIADVYSIRAILQNGGSGGNALVRYMNRHVGGEEPVDPTTVKPQTYVVLKSTSNNEVVEVLFYENSKVLQNEGMAALGAKHYTTSSPSYVELKSRSVGEVVSLESREWTIQSISWIDSFFCKRAFSYLVDSGNCKVLTFDESEGTTLVEQLAAQLKEIDYGNSNIDKYSDGIKINESAIIHLGIEIGNKLFSKNQFGFTVAAVKNPNLVFRRAVDNIAELADCEKDYLLSYNAIVILAMLDLLPNVKERIAATSTVTSSTKNRLIDDIRQLLHDQDASPGSLIMAEDNPVFVEYAEEELIEVRHFCAEALDILDKLSVLEPVDSINLPPFFIFLGTSTCQDISTAKAESKLFVTEDITQAQFIDLEEGVQRCSLYVLFEGCGYGVLAGATLGFQYHNWNAQPVIDFHLALALNEIMRTMDENGEELSAEENNNHDL